MKRPDEHETDSAGERLLRQVLPLGWTLTAPERDYGWDFEVEVFSGGSSTGFTFKVQLKSSKNTAYSSDRTFISQELPRRSARYLAIELTTPVVLIHADVVNNALYWVTPQLDTALAGRLAEGKGKNLTVRVPTANRLPETLASMTGALAGSQFFLASKRIAETPAPNFVAGMTTGPDAESRRSAFLNQADRLRLLRAHELFRSGKIADAIAVLSSISVDPTANIDARFLAELRDHEYRSYELRRFGETPSMSEAVSLSTRSQKRLRALVRKGPAHLKLFALIRNTGLAFRDLVDRDWGLGLNWSLQKAEDDELWRSILLYQRAQNREQIHRKYRQLVRLAELGVKSKYVWVIAQALVEAARGIVAMVGNLLAAGETAGAARFRTIALNWCMLALTLAQKFNDEDAIVTGLLLAFAMPGRVADDEISTWITSTVDGLDDGLHRQMKDMLAQAAAFRPPDEDGDFAELVEIERQIYRNMAESIGIDLSNASNPVAQAVNIGLKDLDPSPVLSRCEHIFLMLGPTTVLAQRLRMPTVGTKMIHCLKHGYATGALQLDAAYAELKVRHCDRCPDVTPRPSTWKYSHEWQQEQNAAFQAQRRLRFSDEQDWTSERD